MFKYLRLMLLLLIPSWSSCGNGDEEMSVPDIDQSIVKVCYEENFIDSLDAVYCEEEYLVLFGFNEVPTGIDSVGNVVLKEERVIYLSSVDKNGGVVTDSTTVIVVDSTNFPVRIANRYMNSVFKKIDDTHFNCAIYDANADEWTEYENIEFLDFAKYDQSRTRAIASSGYSEFGVDDMIKAISITVNLKNGIVNIGKNNLKWIGGAGEDLIKFLNDFNPNDETALIIDFAVSPGILGKITAVGGYLTGKAAAKYEKWFVETFGKVRISIEDLQIVKEQEGKNSCKVYYKIEGLNINGQNNTHAKLILCNIYGEIVDQTQLESRDHSGLYLFDGLPSGRYLIELYLEHKKYPIGPSVVYSFDIFGLTIDDYEINPEPKYEDEKVTFDISFNVDGEIEFINELIKRGAEYGYFVQYGSTRYYKINDQPSPLGSKQILMLEIPRDRFIYTNYSNFCSEATGYNIGTYVKVKNKYITYDKIPLMLIYDEVPKAITGGVVSYTGNNAIVTCEYKNCDFWGVRCGVEYISIDEYASKEIELGINGKDGLYNFNLTNLDEDKCYEYVAYFKINNNKYYGEYLPLGHEGTCIDKNHPHVIDLGLPNGILWSCCNVGATVPEEYGGHYAWGENSVKEAFSWDTYWDSPYDEGNNWVGCQTTTDIAGTDKDVATTVLGEKWRMPTYEEMQELMNKCTWTWTTINGVNGYKVTSNVDGYVGNFIFLPAAGNGDKSGVINKGTYGGYWTSTPLESTSKAAAYNLYFYGETIHAVQNTNRYTGRSIRPVTTASE